MEIASTKTAMIVSAQKRRTPTATLNYKLIDLPNVIVRESLSEMNHHQWIKWKLAALGRKSQKELKVGILLNLENSLLVAKP